MRNLFSVLCLLSSVLFAPLTAHAHGLVFTRVEAMFGTRGVVNITIDYDLSLVLPQPAAHYPLTQSSPETQRAAVERALPLIREALEFYAGDTRLELELQGFALPQLPETAFADPAQDKSTVLRFTAKLPATPAPLVMVVPYGARVHHPVLFAAGSPAAGVLARSWVEEGPSEAFEWAAFAGGVARAPGAAPGGATATSPWYVDFWTYLRLGFKHIVPQGLDHILFVLEKR